MIAKNKSLIKGRLMNRIVVATGRERKNKEVIVMIIMMMMITVMVIIITIAAIATTIIIRINVIIRMKNLEYLKQ